jgi:hypothetical protein
MNRKDELKSVIDKARSELREIEDVESAKKNKAFVGKLFKCRNSCSCPEPNEYWWRYLAVTGMSEDGNLETWNFQKDHLGQIEIEQNILRPDVSDNYIEIRPAEFWKAYDGLLTELNSRTPSKALALERR